MFEETDLARFVSVDRYDNALALARLREDVVAAVAPGKLPAVAGAL
jgi:hypothetical protein